MVAGEPVTIDKSVLNATEPEMYAEEQLGELAPQQTA